MAKIDRVEDLPNWFSREKYQGCESFGAAEWWRELSFRRQLLASNPVYPVAKNAAPTDQGWEFWRQILPKMAAPLRATPINRNDLEALFIVQGKSAPICTTYQGGLISTPMNKHHSPVHTVSMLDLLHQALSDCTPHECQEENDQRKRWAILDNRFGGPFTIDANLAEAPITLNASAVLSINLLKSDSLINQAFAAWLKDARAQQKPANTSKRPAYSRWARYGLLPYLDLLIWSMETDTHIPDRVMSAAISDYDAGEANLRKTIAPLAAGLMSSLSDLKAISAIEAAARDRVKKESFES